MHGLQPEGRSQAVRFEAHFRIAAVSETDIGLPVRTLQRTRLPKEVVIGLRAMYSDNFAFQVGCASPAASEKVWHLCDQAVHIPLRMVIVQTATNPNTWREMMDQILSDDPDCSITKVRYCLPCCGGRSWTTTPQHHSNWGRLPLPAAGGLTSQNRHEQ